MDAYLTPRHQAHNLKVVGSNPTPETNKIGNLDAHMGVFFAWVPIILLKSEAAA